MGLLTEISYTDGEIDTTVWFNGTLTTAYVTDRETGLTARGHAKQSPEDIYDQDTGMGLALSRAMSRLYRKMEKRYIKETY